MRREDGGQVDEMGGWCCGQGRLGARSMSFSHDTLIRSPSSKVPGAFYFIKPLFKFLF